MGIEAAAVARPVRHRALPLLPALLLTALTAAAAPAKPAERLTPAELSDRYEKCLKTLAKARDATEGHDAGRVSLLLQRADELLVEFEAGSGLDTFIAAVASARAAADKGDFASARTDLRRGRESLRSLSDYTVARSTEVAYRSADAALEDANSYDFSAAVGRLEATVLPGFLHDRIAEARGAMARGRTAMVRRDMATGRKEIDAARIALGRLDYASALGQSRYALIVGAELLEGNAILAARDQVQDGLRQIKRAFRRAPATDVDSLNAAQAEVDEIWRRLNKPEPGDADRLAKAADLLETLRQRLR